MVKLTITIPLNWNLSKNKKTVKSRGRIVGNSAHYAILQRIAGEVAMQSKADGLEWKRKPTSLRIEVFKKTRRGDGINFIDGIADAVFKRKGKRGKIVSTGIGIDDCWLDNLDFKQSIDKDNQRIVITVWQ